MIKIKAGSTIYIDSNVIIYYAEYKGEFRERAAGLFRHAIDIGAQRFTSEVAVAECLYQPYREKKTAQVLLYQNIFRPGQFNLIPLTGDLAVRAAEEGGALGLKLLDAIHYMSALEAGCDVFVTADRKFRSTRYLEVVGI